MDSLTPWDSSPFKCQQKTAFWIRFVQSIVQGPLARYVSGGWRTSTVMSQKYSRAVYVAAAIFNSECGDSPPRIRPFTFEGRGEEKSPSRWGTGPFTHGRFGTSQKKIHHTCTIVGVASRPEEIA